MVLLTACLLVAMDGCLATVLVELGLKKRKEKDVNYTTHITLCSDHFIWQQAVQTEAIPICHQSVPHLSVHCIAVNITVLLTTLTQLLQMVATSSQHIVTSNKNIHYTSKFHLNEPHAMTETAVN